MIIPVLSVSRLQTPLGHMIAIADDTALYCLEFCDYHNKLERFKHKTQATFIDGRTVIIDTLEEELSGYFAGTLNQFSTPIIFFGTPFQQKVWQTLQTISYGCTYSYAQLAQAIGHPSAWRAVAQANAANNVPIIIPCHRVINTGGALGGYRSGLPRKIWLLDHEKNTQ